ncbi:MAG: ATP-binding cassette domain-containing protein [Rhodobacterales bacterium]|nr:ATP-binding cassette domain-containing protein [Rhodobacterales bacterium]MDX5390736.1 ATP-binding cassette domain-containing protein [Rhodobacterales bacterium]MDX5490437.1 ATP-binding cassette domain-containing protein [Rhodobacterales bacterium]
MTEGLRLEHLTIGLGERRLVDLDGCIAPGEILTVMGPSGSGKSTLLSVLIGQPDPGFAVSGRVLLDGQDLSGLGPQARRIGLLFQDDLLFPHLSVGENLAFALPASIKGRAAREARIAAALEAADLGGFADRDPATLSGGQRARVALMRCLLSAPRALLLDEPFSRLDADLRRQMREFVFGRVRAEGIPAILVTHDLEDALAARGKVISPLGELRQTGGPA